jgi:hypothetical protein
VRELFTGDGRPRERSTFSASQIIANDPAWTDHVFDPPWPPGTVINDKIAGTVYRAAPSPEQVGAAPDEPIRDLLAEMRSREINQAVQKQPVLSDLTLPEPPGQSPRGLTSALSEPAEKVSTGATTQPGHTINVYTPSKRKPEAAARTDNDTPGLSPPMKNAPAATHGRRPELLVLLLGAGALALIAIVLIRGRRVADPFC